MKSTSCMDSGPYNGRKPTKRRRHRSGRSPTSPAKRKHRLTNGTLSEHDLTPTSDEPARPFRAKKHHGAVVRPSPSSSRRSCNGIVDADLVAKRLSFGSCRLDSVRPALQNDVLSTKNRRTTRAGLKQSVVCNGSSPKAAAGSGCSSGSSVASSQDSGFAGSSSQETDNTARQSDAAECRPDSAGSVGPKTRFRGMRLRQPEPLALVRRQISENERDQRLASRRSRKRLMDRHGLPLEWFKQVLPAARDLSAPLRWRCAHCGCLFESKLSRTSHLRAKHSTKRPTLSRRARLEIDAKKTRPFYDGNIAIPKSLLSLIKTTADTQPIRNQSDGLDERTVRIIQPDVYLEDSLPFGVGHPRPQPPQLKIFPV